MSPVKSPLSCRRFVRESFSLLRFVALSGLLSLTLCAPAHAYLDAATGGMILQLLLGGVAGLVVILKLYWEKVLRFFGRQPAEEPGDEQHSESTPLPERKLEG